MGLYYLFGLCFAFLSFSSLAADPPVPRGNVSVTVNPTTSYYSSTSSTFRIPHGVSVSPVTSSVPVVTKYPGGLQQTIPTGITIDAIKKSAPLPAVVRSSTQSIKAAATRCLTSARCNIGLILAGEGLNRLFDGLDWVMSEGGKIQYSGDGLWSVYDGAPAGWQLQYADTQFLGRRCDQIDAGFACVRTTDGPTSYGCRAQAGSGSGAIPLSGYSSGICYYGGDGYASLDYVDAPDSVISDGVESSYEPEPSDWPALTPELKLDDVEITSAPTLTSNPKITTIYDADGNPVQVKETNVWYEFDVRNNPSSSPELDLKTREQTKTYEDGVLTDTTETESISSGGAVVPKVDIPTDCDFMPTICAFLDWFKDDNLPEDPDLAKIINDEDFERNYTVNFGDNSCPQPISIDIAFLDKTIELSYEPACDLMGYARPFVLISAYIFAIYIGLGVVRNG